MVEGQKSTPKICHFEKDEISSHDADGFTPYLSCYMNHVEFELISALLK
jgi:hypothetical protein